MFMIHMPLSFAVGDRAPVRINQEAATLFWRDPQTLVINDTEERLIFERMRDGDLQVFVCDAGASISIELDAEGCPQLRTRLFPLGEICITPEAETVLTEANVSPRMLLDRHQSGDWGDLVPEDVEENNRALCEGARLLSEYRIGGFERVWVITEHDRSVTTILQPDEY